MMRMVVTWLEKGLMWRILVFQMLIFNLHIPISKMNEDMNFIFISMQNSSSIFKY